MTNEQIMAILDDTMARLKEVGVTEFVMAIGGDNITSVHMFGNYKQCGYLALQVQWEVMTWQEKNSVLDGGVNGN
jgi:hypothetical protein